MSDANPERTTAKGKPRCQGAKCGEKYKPYPWSKFRYTAKQCEKACDEGSLLCKICTQHETKYLTGELGGYHGVYGGPVPTGSHMRKGSWEARQNVLNAAQLLKEEKKVERGATKAAKSQKVTRKKTSSKSRSRSQRSKSQRSKSRSKSQSGSVIYKRASRSSNARSSSGRQVALLHRKVSPNSEKHEPKPDVFDLPELE